MTPGAPSRIVGSARSPDPHGRTAEAPRSRPSGSAVATGQSWPAAAAASLLLLAVSGCAALGIGQKRGGGDGAAAADTVARGESAADGGGAAARADSGRSLRDSVLAVLKARRGGGDTAGADAGGQGAPEEEDGGDREPDVEGDGPAGPVLVADVDSLKALGPVYTPYDVPPLLQSENVEGLLRATILPVIRRHELDPDEWARFWVLVDRQGRVVDQRLHLTSGHAAFDDAAAAAAGSLRYRPARRDGGPVPVWVLVRVSLLMQ